jgi:glycosyltransferase involved in cell wall biosynthesis
MEPQGIHATTDRLSRLRGVGGRAVMVVGPLPPPYIGPAIATQVICAAFEQSGTSVVHVNTQDRRPPFKIGVLDARNVGLGAYHGAKMAWRAIRYPVCLVYLPISQGRWGYVRDAVFFTIARAFRMPIVVHLHGSNLQRFYGESTFLERAIIRRTLGWSRRALALTPSLSGVFEGLVPADRVGILENAICDPWPEGIDDLRRVRRRRAAAPDARVHVLFVANNWLAKGAATLVRALASPGLERTTARFVGSPRPSTLDATRRLAGELGIRDRVEFVGPRSGVEKWSEFEWADIFAYPSDNDGQPLVVLEAMASGLPVVASSYGGIPDTLGDAGTLVAPGDAEGLAAALASLVADTELRERMGAASRERYTAHYTVDAFQARFESVFGDLLAPGGPTSSSLDSVGRGAGSPGEAPAAPRRTRP